VPVIGNLKSTHQSQYYELTTVMHRLTLTFTH